MAQKIMRVVKHNPTKNKYTASYIMWNNGKGLFSILSGSKWRDTTIKSEGKAKELGYVYFYGETFINEWHEDLGPLNGDSRFETINKSLASLKRECVKVKNGEISACDKNKKDLSETIRKILKISESS